MKNFFTKTRIAITMIAAHAVNFVLFLQANAQTPPPIIPAGVTDPIRIPHNMSGANNSDYLTGQLLPGIATTIIALSGGLALVFVIIGGIQYLTAYGDPGKAETAKKTITYALIGVIVGGLSYAIVAIIASINPSPATKKTS